MLHSGVFGAWSVGRPLVPGHCFLDIITLIYCLIVLQWRLCLARLEILSSKIRLFDLNLNKKMLVLGMKDNAFHLVLLGLRCISITSLDLSIGVPARILPMALADIVVLGLFRNL